MPDWSVGIIGYFAIACDFLRPVISDKLETKKQDDAELAKIFPDRSLPNPALRIYPHTTVIEVWKLWLTQRVWFLVRLIYFFGILNSKIADVLM